MDKVKQKEITRSETITHLFGGPIEETISALQERADKHPGATTEVEIEYGFYDSKSPEVYLRWREIETPEEAIKRAEEEAARKAKNDQWDRDQFERLKKKFENEQ